MSDDRGTETFTAGALVRRHARTALDVRGLTWREHKGWTESTFIVSGTASQIRSMRRWVAEAAR